MQRKDKGDQREIQYYILCAFFPVFMHIKLNSFFVLFWSFFVGEVGMCYAGEINFVYDGSAFIRVLCWLR